MEIDLKPKLKRKPRKKKKFSSSDEDTNDNENSGYTMGYVDNNSLLRAVGSIVDDNSPRTQNSKKTPKKKFVEPDTDKVSYTQISIPSNMRSVFWKYFGFPADDYGEILTKKRLVCVICTSTLGYVGNTSNMRAHLRCKHPVQFNELVAMPQNEIESKSKKSSKESYPRVIKVQGNKAGDEAVISIPSSSMMQIKGESHSSPYVHHSSGKSLVDLMIDNIILDLQPPSSVNFSGLRHLVSNLTVQCNIPTESTIIQEYIPKMYDCLKNTMYNDITALNLTDYYFSLAVDHWKADDREYVSYFINYLQNEEVFTTKLLHTFCLEKENIYNAEYHQDVFNIICSSWNIKVLNINAILLSSDSDMLHSVVENTGTPVIPCLINTLNEMCLKSFHLERVDKILQICRSTITKIYNKNHFAINVTVEEQEGDSSYLTLDNPLVWTTTLTMFETLKDTRSKLDVILETEGAMEYEAMTEEDWFILSKLVEVYNPIKVTVTTLSEERPAHASLILPLYLQLINYHLKVNAGDDEVTMQMKSFFVEYLQKKYSPVESFLQICTALDPRVKKVPCIDSNNVLNGPVKELLMTMEPCSESTKYYNEVIEQDSKKNRLSGMAFLLGGPPSAETHKKNSEASHEDNMTYEIEQYKKAIGAELNECPLKWWKSHCNKFPNLYSLALRYNCIPAHTLPYNKIESNALCTYIDKRNTLSRNCQHVLNHLLFLHHNYSV